MKTGVRILPFLVASVGVHALVIGLLGAEQLTLALTPSGAGHEVSVRLEAAAPMRAAAAPQAAPVPTPAPRPTATAPAAETATATTPVAETRRPEPADTASTAGAQSRQRTPEAEPPAAESRARPDEPAPRVAQAGAAEAGADSARSEASRREVRDAIVTRLARYFRYPRLARQRGWQGTVVLSVRILSDGRLSDIRVKRSSGRALLDRSATESLARVKRIPQLADRIGDNGLALEIPVTYRLEAA